jgi:hypothetical protein
MIPALRSLAPLLTAVALFAAAPLASGQGCVPDNMDGPCCAPVGPVLPQFPGVSTPGLGVCWTNCNPSQINPLKVVWPAPLQFPCASYDTPLDVFDAGSGAHILSGKLHLDYSRTWREADVTGQPYQVWRFVAKADMRAIPPTTPPGGPICPTPPSLIPFGPHPSAFFYGYVDYALKCGQPNFENTMVLFHASDHFINTPFSAFPVPAGGLNPINSFAIVAFPPGQNFMPMNTPAPGGPLVAGSMRATPALGALGCTARDRLVGGNITPFAGACLCIPFAAFPQQVTLRTFNGVANCVDATGQPNAFQTLALGFPTLPWFHLMTHSIGFFTSPQIYPGQEVAWVDEGLLRDRDACAGQSLFEVFYGASTAKGWQVVSTAANPLTQNFTDIADNFSTLGTASLPLFGIVMPTNHVINANVP